ncbi:MAG: hypothetical protein ACI9TO_000268, partial [Rickettsiales bacterium]
QQKKLVEVKKIVSKDRQLKVKIKHLEKEITRIDRSSDIGNGDKKAIFEKSIIEKKLAKLKASEKKIIKASSRKPADK